VHFSLFGTVPNLVFISFALILFFSGRPALYQTLFLSLIAGIFLDIFSSAYIGTHVLAFFLIGIIFMRVRFMLKNPSVKNPFAYFLPLFALFFTLYFSLVQFLFYLSVKSAIGLSWNIAFELLYSIGVAAAVFFLYKKLIKSGIDDRQLTLFKE